MLNVWNPADTVQVLSVVARLHSYAGFLIWLVLGPRLVKRECKTGPERIS